MRELTITQNGDYTLPKAPSWSRTMVYASALGGATIAATVNGIPLGNNITGNAKSLLEHGQDCEVTLTVTGYTTNITLNTCSFS